MTKKRVKLAVIRSNEDTPCPFGLSVPSGCKSAGNVIDRMFPVEKLGLHATEEERKKIAKANKRLLNWVIMESSEAPQECKYAAHLFPDRNKVDCDWGDTAAGQSSQGSLLGSPFYSQVMTGPSMSGMYSYPLGYMADSPLSRNVFFGITSIQGSSKISNDELRKLAEEAIYKANKEKVNG